MTPWYTDRLVLVIGLEALFLGTVTLLVLASGTSLFRARTTLAQRLSGTVPAEGVRGAARRSDGVVARSAVELASRLVAVRGVDRSLVQRLQAAALPLRPAEWVLAHAGTAVATALLFLLLSGSGVAGVAGLALGATAPWWYLGWRVRRRRAAFLTQLPDMLTLVAGGLTAGYSLAQAFDAAVREGNQPMAAELSRALVESRLGVDLEDALDEVATRMSSRDFAWLVMAIRIQREVGGNLSKVLATVAETLRDRERIRRQVQVLSAEGRLSAAILGALPVVFALYLMLVRPAYISLLWTDPIGLLLLAVLAVTLSVGVLWLRKVVKVEV